MAKKIMANYLIDIWRDEDGIRVTHTSHSKENYISCLFLRLSERLIKGSQPDPWGALVELQEKYPKRLTAVIEALLNNQTEEGLLEFETSMIAGYKKIGKWRE